MNWVGGARHRLKLQGEKKLQREFFEKKKFGLKTARRHKKSPKRRRTISQDLMALQTVSSAHADQFSFMNSVNRPIKNMDFEKHEQAFGKRLTEDVQLGSSPVGTPSQLQLMEAKDQKRSGSTYRPKEHFLSQVPEEDEEFISPTSGYDSISKDANKWMNQENISSNRIPDLMLSSTLTSDNTCYNNSQHFDIDQNKNQEQTKVSFESDFRHRDIYSSESMIQTRDLMEKQQCYTVSTQTAFPCTSEFKTICIQTAKVPVVDVSTSTVKTAMVDSETQCYPQMFTPED